MNNSFSYEDYCRIVGDLYLSAQAQKFQAQVFIDRLNEQVATLQKDNRELKNIYQCNTQNEKA